MGEASLGVTDKASVKLDALGVKMQPNSHFGVKYHDIGLADD